MEVVAVVVEVLAVITVLVLVIHLWRGGDGCVGSVLVMLVVIYFITDM